MEVMGICEICGKPRKLFTTIDGRRICAECMGRMGSAGAKELGRK